MKKNIISLVLLALLMLSCKKDNIILKNTQHHSDSVKIGTPNSPNSFALEPIEETSGHGKTVFQDKGKTVIYFNSQSQTGKIKINGKEYKLDKMTFTENNYEISGKEILIRAEDGDFKEMISDCMSGTFPMITVIFNGQKSVLKNVIVQDCPEYN